MASISPPTPPHKLSFRTPKFIPKRLYCPSPCPPFPSSSSSSSTSLCRCTNSSSSSDGWRWDSAFQGVIDSAIKRIDSFINPRRKEVAGGVDEERASGKGEKDEDDDEWDWDRWRRHFQEVDEQERIVSYPS